MALAANGSAVIVGTNGITGVYFLREAGENFGMAVSVPEVGSINAAWAFPRIVSTSGPVNSFLIAGNYMPTPEAAFARLLRFNDDGTFSALQDVPLDNAEGDVTALYFHDQVVGYAGTSSGQLFRTGTTSVDHSTFAWGAALATDDQLLPTQPYTGPMSIRTIGSSSRHRGFMGGSYNSTANYARVITDESGLYSQRFWYDKLGRIVLSQNSKQFNASAHKQYSYSLYDELGRVHEAGQVTDFNDDLAAVFGAAVQNVVQPFTIDPQNLLAWLDGQPTGSRTEVVRTIYDEDLLGSGSFFSTHEQENLRLRVAATLYLDNGEHIDHASAYSYDIHGNVKELVQYHARLAGDCAGCTDGGIKHLQYIYDLISGNVKQVSYQAGKPDQFHHRYRYDADNRIDRVETSRNALTWREDARYFYYPHGPLQRVELGNDKVQGVDYAYTLQGWLKGINSTLLTPENDMGQDAAYELSGNPNALIGRDVYGLSLGYYGDNDYAAIDDSRWSTVADRPFAPIGTTGTLFDNHQELYNGNIAHTTNTLAPFGGYPNSAVAPGQVLAMVYQYDQLNRLKQAKGVTGITTGNTWDAITDATANRYKSEYAYDANGNIMAAERYDQAGNQYDGLEYRYHVDGNGNKVRNRLYQLLDLADQEDDFANDISDLPFQDTEIVDPQGIGSGGWINEDNNYRYDELGNLIRDAREEIDLIEWTVSGKVRAVHRTPSSSRMPLSFGYGAGGQRITKVVGDPDASTPTGYREHYIRDAQGNVMATYRHQLLPVTGPEPGFEASLKLTERPIYGSSRLGVDAHALELGGLGPEDPNPYLLDNPIGKVHYELTDHLGNVTTVITDELIGVDIEDNASAFEYFQPYLVSAQGYEPFGSLLPGRNYRQPTGPPPPPVTPKGSLVITEFSNGPATGTTSGNCEYVELYVTKCALYPEATAVDIRGWIIDDNAGNFNISGGCGMGVAISAGHLIFAQVAAWATVPVGSVIVLYNGADNCYSFTPNESGTGGVYMVNVNSTTLIQRTGSGATPNGSTADCDYCENSYTATADSPSSWGSVFSLGNTADAVQVRCPDCPEAEAGFFHGVGYGTGFGAVAPGMNDLGGAYKSGSGSGRTYELTGTGCGSLGDGAGWSHSTAPAAGTPPATVGTVDAGVLAWLENCSVPCCVSFEAPEVAAQHSYRYGFNGQEKDDEVFGATGTSYTAEFWQYDSRVARRWNIDPILHHYQSNYSVFSNNPIIFIDPNGKADFYNKKGKWIGTDGNDNGKRYVSSNHKLRREIQNVSKRGEFVRQNISEHRSLLRIPSPAVRQMMEVHRNETLTTGAEHGGHARQDGIPVAWDPGTKLSSYTVKDIEYSVATVTMFKVNGKLDAPPPGELSVHWHVHPSGASGYASSGEYLDETGNRRGTDVGNQKELEDGGYTNDAIVVGAVGGVRYYDGQGDRGSAGRMKSFLGIGTEKSDKSRMRRKFDAARNKSE